MDERLARLFKDFEFDGTEELSVTEINGVDLPKDYLRFMSENGGGEGALFGVTRQGEYFAADLEEIREDEIEIMCGSFEKFIVKASNGDYF